MITRAEAAKMVNEHFDEGFKGVLPVKHGHPTFHKIPWHYGRVEVRALLDAIYGPPNPLNLDEHIKTG
jgi:hypothetical protein